VINPNNGDVNCMYSEETGAHFHGTVKEAEKVSDVKFDSASQEWVALDRKTKEVIARDPSRKACVQKEHAYYENKIADGDFPWENQ